jgi:hypothetical protein
MPRRPRRLRNQAALGDNIGGVQATATPSEVTATPAEAQTAGRAYAVAWAKSASLEDLDALLRVQPKIPTELDVALLVEAEKTVGPLRERQDLKRELRAAFWAAIKAAKETPGTPS